MIPYVGVDKIPHPNSLEVMGPVVFRYFFYKVVGTKWVIILVNILSQRCSIFFRTKLRICTNGKNILVSYIQNSKVSPS